ncbi:MAG: phage tail assembly chaperone [Rhizobiales bacterium]|nr:phage tail assembly chaperone [Hyphomicrobiales bacterium]
MHLGLGELGLSSSEFWSATLRELSMAMRAQAAPPSRDGLDDLMKRFPDL